MRCIVKNTTIKYGEQSYPEGSIIDIQDMQGLEKYLEPVNEEKKDEKKKGGKNERK